MSLTRKTLSGMAWTGASTFGITVLNFVTTAVLARLLNPADFGLMGMVLIVTGFAAMLADFGLAAAVIQKKDVSESELSTLFFMNILIGGMLCAACFFFSGLIADFFRRDELTDLLKVMSLLFVLLSMGQLFRTLFQKEMQFKTLFKIDLSTTAIYGIVSIGMALKGFGVWSLVWGFLLKQVADTILLTLFSRFRPKLIFDPMAIRDLLRFGVFVLGERILNYFNRNLDYIIIGRFLGAAELGCYTLAYNLMLVPVSKIASVVTQVMFPAFAQIQNDNLRLRNAYTRIIKYIAIVTFPIMAILFSVAGEFVDVVYGAKWHKAITVLQILCFVGALQSIATTVGTIWYAKGRSDIGFKWNCFALCFYAVAFGLGVRWEINGVAALYAIFGFLMFPVAQGITNKLIALDWPFFLSNLWKQAAGACLIVAAIYLAKFKILYPMNFSQPAILVISTLLAGIVYATFLLMADKNLIRESLEMIRSKSERTAVKAAA